MPIILPSHPVPITLVADILICIGTDELTSLDKIKAYTDKGDTYVKSGINTAKLLGLMDNNRGGEVYSVNPEVLNLLGLTPNDDLKINVIRKYIQRYDPFIRFIQYYMNGSSLSDAARKVFAKYDFQSSSGYKLLKQLFIAWGKSTNIFTVSGETLTLTNEIQNDYNTHMKLDVTLNNEMAIRLYINQRLGDDVIAFIENADIEELVDSYKKYSTEPRDAIGCAGRAFENFLRRTAVPLGVDVVKKNGITQVIQTIQSEGKIHSKQNSIGGGIGTIRNMSGHGVDPKELEPWDLKPQSALAFIELVISAIRSIKLYIEKNTLTF